MNYRKSYLAVTNTRSFMPADTDRLSNFWQELKRRKVIRVLTVFAAATFMILEVMTPGE